MIIDLLADEWEKSISKPAVIDYKSRLQEITQSKFQLTPAYRLVAEKGPAHDKTFTIEVTAGSRTLGEGTGKSKKIAETEAARAALERLSEGFTG